MKRILLNLLHLLLPVLLVAYSMVEYDVRKYAEANAAFYTLDFFRLAAGVVFGLLLYGCAAAKARPLWPGVSLVLLIGAALCYFFWPVVVRLLSMPLLGISLAIEGLALARAVRGRKRTT